MSKCKSFEWNPIELLLSKVTYYQRNRDVVLNRAKDCYENVKERLRGQAKDKYKNLSEEEKTKRENMEKTDTTICLTKKNKD